MIVESIFTVKSWLGLKRQEVKCFFENPRLKAWLTVWYFLQIKLFGKKDDTDIGGGGRACGKRPDDLKTFFLF